MAVAPANLRVLGGRNKVHARNKNARSMRPRCAFVGVLSRLLRLADLRSQLFKVGLDEPVFAMNIVQTRRGALFFHTSETPSNKFAAQYSPTQFLSFRVSES